MEKKKIIGTFVPISALFSAQQSEQEQGTFAAGEVFLDWLKKNHQSAWQFLPLHENKLEPGSSTKHVPSPFQSYGIGLDPQYLPAAFATKIPTEQEKKFFCLEHQEWIDDYVLFCSIRDEVGTDNWQTWDKELRNRHPEALAQLRKKLASRIEYHINQQWQLHAAYNVLRQKAKREKILLIGDMPFYPSLQSPLVWAHQEAFQLTKDREMRYVSGNPNLLNTHFGRQIWGHPLYNWHEQLDQVVVLWKMRLRYQAAIFDDIRFDHATGFFAYGVMDLHDEKNDRYNPGPGAEVFKALISFARSQGLSILAEDNGARNEELREVLEEVHVPGLRIFRFALSKYGLNERYAQISKYPQNCVAYTTTHDTETLLGYVESLPPEQKKQIAEIIGIKYNADDKHFASSIRNAIIDSPAEMVIIPMQDWLLITDRINIPGTEKAVGDSNWQFRLGMPIEELPRLRV